MAIDRRGFIHNSALTGAGVALAGAAGIGGAPAAAADEPDRREGHKPDRYSFTILGTTDLHSHVFNWDYYANADATDAKGDQVGIAKIATLVEEQRELKGRHRTLLIDAGDIIQGTPLGFYYATVDPITGANGRPGPIHPMAAAMNHMRYDAAALGNHEFNYGIPLLRAFQEQCDFPLLGANALHAADLRPAFPPYAIKHVPVPGRPDIKVGVIGLTNPGIAIWDKDNVTGKMVFPGLVEQAAKYVPRLRSLGCDVVFLTDHSGLDGSSSYGDTLPYVENASNLVAENVPGIDAILVGHTHVEVPSYTVTNQQTGKDVVLSEPFCWGKRLSVFDFEVEFHHGRWQVASVTADVLNANTAEEDPEIVALLKADHDAVVTYVNQPIGVCAQDMSAAESCWKDTAIIDFINYVQTQNVKAALTGADAELPVVSLASPFSRTADIPQGQVTIRDIAGLYVYDNTLYAKKLTGAQLRDYLEFAATYYNQVPSGTPVDTATLTNHAGTPDYAYDVMSGVAYEIDIAQPAGSRIANLSYDGAPIDDAQEFVVAVNNYRASGGSGYPHIATAEIVFSSNQDIRQSLIDYAVAANGIDPGVFFTENWRLTQDGVPAF
jgi:2',3'-cyclic-nucleotide 2'-phosphodiesterase / 3'-nucleotidase